MCANEIQQREAVKERLKSRIQGLEEELKKSKEESEELKQKQGAQFNLKSFHEKFLSYGSAPVKYIRKLMLAEIDQEKK